MYSRFLYLNLSLTPITLADIIFSYYKSQPIASYQLSVKLLHKECFSMFPIIFTATIPISPYGINTGMCVKIALYIYIFPISRSF